MPKQIALAYGIAGLAVAVALLVVLGSTTGLFSDKVVPEAVATEAVAPAPLPAPLPPEKQAEPAPPEPVAQPVEYVYVDEPAPQKRRHHDDDHEDDDHEESDDD